MVGFALSGDLAGARTQDPLLKREMLYQLSYQVLSSLWVSGPAPAVATPSALRRRVQIYYHYSIIPRVFRINLSSIRQEHKYHRNTGL